MTKLPEIRISKNEPQLHDPAQKTFISVAKLNNPQRASPVYMDGKDFRDSLEVKMSVEGIDTPARRKLADLLNR